jgi:hypothetical protein
MTLETLTLILLVAGLIPWHISRRIVGRRPNLATRWQAYALFGRLTVECPQRRSRRSIAWRLTIPLLPRLSDAIWAALRRLVE